MADIVITNLNKRFGDFVAVNNVNLTIKDGEFFVLLGPSGCGKTTTLRMIAGLELATDGTISLDKKDVTFLRASQRDIAFVFQLFALYPHLNVAKNIGFPLKLQGIPRKEIKIKVREVAKFLRLEHLLNKKISGLSGGDRQRVALARAIIRRPKAFLLDEPLGALDSQFREAMLVELKKLHDDIRTTTVYVTHDQIEAMTMGNRIGIMNKGVLLQADEPLTIYNKPRTMFVGGFTGSPAMNFIKIKSQIEKGDRSVRVNGARIEIPEIYENSNTDTNFMGIRPENISISEPEKGNIKGQVFAVEYLSSHNIVTIDTDIGRVRTRTSAKLKAKIKDNVGLNFDQDNIIIFNGDNEIAIKSQFMS